MKGLTIGFAGTPAFTLPCLNALHDSRHHLKAIYTQPDRPAGRGRAMQASAVKTWALEHNVSVYQPLNFKEKETRDILQHLALDVLVVIAYGLILPAAVLAIPRLGCINVHASLLPRWRGASPIQQSILHGDTETGITIMQMDVGMDTGPAFTTAHCAISTEDTASTLHDKLATCATSPLLETLDALENNRAILTPQTSSLVTYAPKILKTDALINWSNTAITIDQAIRAYNPWPIAYTTINDSTIRVYKSKVTTQPCHSITPGTILSIEKEGLLIATKDHALLLETIQLPGSRAMSVAECLRGEPTRFLKGQCFQ